MGSVSIFKSFAQFVENKTLSDIIFEIQDGKYMTEVEVIRKLITSGKTKEADKLKKQLPAFTPSGTFDNGRKAELISTDRNTIGRSKIKGDTNCLYLRCLCQPKWKRIENYHSSEYASRQPQTCHATGGSVLRECFSNHS